MLACGGGGHLSLWRQMLADTYNCPVKTVKSREGPALGVAILAGVGVGLYPSVQEACQAMIQLNPRPGAPSRRICPSTRLLTRFQEPVPGPEKEKLQAAGRHRRLSGGKLNA